MNLKSLLEKYKTDRTRVLINGLGEGDVKGTIIEVNDDYIAYELLEVEKEKKTDKEKQVREVVYIPISNILSLSEGRKEKAVAGGLAGFTVTPP